MSDLGQERSLMQRQLVLAQEDNQALRQRVAESENKLNEQSFKLIAMTERAEKAEAALAEQKGDE